MNDRDDSNNKKESVKKEKEEKLETIHYFWPLPSENCKNGTCNCAMH